MYKATKMEEGKQKEMEKFLKYKNEPYIKPVNIYKYKFIPCNHIPAAAIS